MKICPNCASEKIDWITPIDSTLWICETCEYIGPVIEGNAKLISELIQDCIKIVEEEKNTYDTEKKLTKKSVILSQDYLEKINQIEGKGFSSKMKFILDSYFSQKETAESEEELINGIDKNIAEIYEKLKKEILSWNREIKFKAKGDYLAFSNNSTFLKLCLDKDKINLELSFSYTKPFDDYKEITEEIITENESDEIIRLNFSLNSYDEIEYALFLIKQSYENNKNSLFENVLVKIFPQSKDF